MKEDKHLILVDPEDREIGTSPKLKAHQLGLLHRAYSIFVFYEGKLLLQQRALHKYHSGGLWSNTCCSHPEPSCAIDLHATRRLYEEMGIRVFLEKKGVFTYKVTLPNGLIEYEIDHLFVGHINHQQIRFNPDEVMDYRFVSVPALIQEIHTHPQHYTFWLLPALHQLYRNNLKNREFGKEAPQNFDAERATIAEGQGASEHQNSEAKPTEPKPDSSGYFGICLH